MFSDGKGPTAAIPKDVASTIASMRELVTDWPGTAVINPSAKAICWLANALTDSEQELDKERKHWQRYPGHLEFWTSDRNPDHPLAVPQMLTALNIDPQLDGNYRHWVLLAQPGTRESFGAKP